MDLKIISLTSENYSKVVREHSPELPDMETLKSYEEKSTSDTNLYNMGVITSKGNLVGFGRYVSGTWDPILRPGYVEVTINVDKGWRNKGIGSLILEDIENLARKNNAKVLQVDVMDTAEVELEWAKKRGFEINNHTFDSQLNLSLFDKSQYDSTIENLESSGIHFTSLAEYPQDDDMIHNRYWDFWWELVTDVPDMENKPRPDNERMISMAKDFDKKGFILAVDDGEWIALSMTVKGDDFCYNSMTGVKPEYRGKGIASAIKVKAIEYAMQSGVKYVRTHNDSNNSPMLSVNKKLGYISNPGIFGLTKSIN